MLRTEKPLFPSTPYPHVPSLLRAQVKRATLLAPRTLSLLRSNRAALFSALDLTMEYGEDVTPFHANLAAAAVLAEAAISRGASILLSRKLRRRSPFRIPGLRVQRNVGVRINTIEGFVAQTRASRTIRKSNAVKPQVGQMGQKTLLGNCLGIRYKCSNCVLWEMCTPIPDSAGRSMFDHA